MGVLVPAPTAIDEVGLTLEGIVLSTHGAETVTKLNSNLYHVMFSYDIYANADAYAAGKQPIARRTERLEVTQMQLDTVPIFEIVFNRLVALFPSGTQYQSSALTDARASLAAAAQAVADQKIVVDSTPSDDACATLGRYVDDLKTKQNEVSATAAENVALLSDAIAALESRLTSANLEKADADVDVSNANTIAESALATLIARQ